jgi:hypothetical protein
MKDQERVYTLLVGGRATLAFPAHSLQEAQSLLREEWLRSDLREAKSDGEPLWDSQAKLSVRNALPDEMARFEREAKNLPADDDLPIVYLVQLY